MQLVKLLHDNLVNLYVPPLRKALFAYHANEIAIPIDGLLALFVGEVEAGDIVALDG